MTKLKDKIIELRNNGLSYNEIKDKLKCSKGTICYHLADDQKQKTYKRTLKRRSKQHPYSMKLETFKSKYNKPKTKNQIHKWKKLLNGKIYTFFQDRVTMNNNKQTFTVDDIIEQFGETPKCYLTGQAIDIYQPRTYNFDHIKPVSKGGENTLDNLGICTKQANFSKSDMELDEFINLCKMVVNNFSK